jgi:hypothetical protein
MASRNTPRRRSAKDRGTFLTSITIARTGATGLHLQTLYLSKEHDFGRPTNKRLLTIIQIQSR